MNKLWIRISLTFVGIILVLIIPLVFIIGGRTFDFDENRGRPGGTDLLERLFFREEEFYEVGEDDHYRPVPGILVVRAVFPIMFGVVAVGLLSGVIISRGLTAPLENLAEGAKALAAKDLSQRVEIKGSTEMRSVARAFNEMASELEQAETLRQNLLADVAHELRTPLTVLQGSLRAILDDVYELDKSEIARLYDQSTHLAHLVEDLREIAQAEAAQLPLHLEPVNITDLCTQAASIFQPLTREKGIALEAEIPANLPQIIGDKARLTQGLHNLLDNALRYTSEGGIITVSAGREQNTVWVRIKDTGEGIDPQHLPHVFDRFYRPDDARSREKGGSGLGLAIVKAFIELQGGTVTVQSEGLGKGASFTLRLPIN